MNSIKTILVIGAGTMGKQIAGRAAAKGYTVFLQDSSLGVLQAVERDFQQSATGSSIKYLEKIENMKGVPDLIIESIWENLAAKRRILKTLAKVFSLCSSNLIVCTNTSSLLPSVISRGSKLSPRYCALHFHSPEYGATVVDIMPHSKTDPDIVLTLVDFVKNLDLDPIVLRKENPGYIFNNILDAINEACVRLVLLGVATEEEVDKAWILNTHLKIGPFGMLDMVGLDTALAITRQKAKTAPKQWFGVRYFEKFVNQGKLGIKSGEGFYKYPHPSYEKFLDQANSGS